MQELIKPGCFTKEWIIVKSKELSGDPVLIEKTLHAFALLGYLVQLEDNFIFKGGTNLLLHVVQIKRLSIDIDIIFGGDIEKFIEKISKISEKAPFTRFEENVRGDQGLPNRKHFKFFYTSSISDKEDSILLDIVLDNPSYILPSAMSKPIAGDFIETETELSVTLPTVEGLLGDKLTAFAPRTIGVPFETSSGQSMTMQVVKQLYDIGELFNIATDFNDVSSAFKATFIKETGYRKDEFTEKQVLQDTINTCLALCQIRLKGFKTNTDTDYLEDGIRRLSSHLLNEKFRTDIEAKIFASKVFCIANKILNNNSFDFSNSRYNLDKIEQIKDIQLSAPYERLNRLKQILPEAFYYIWQGIIE